MRIRLATPCEHCTVKDTCESKPESGIAHLSSAVEVEIKQGDFLKRIVAGICEEASQGVAHDMSYLDGNTTRVMAFMRLSGLETVSVDLESLQPALPVEPAETDNLRQSLQFLDDYPTSNN